MKTALLLMCATVSLVAQPARPMKGSISGSVLDGTTQERLPSVNVLVVEHPSAGASTDSAGSFSIVDLDVGEYSLRVFLLGYEPVVVTNVVVSTGRSAKVVVKLHEAPLQGGAVDVRADYFRRAGALSPISTTSLDAAEVRRSPGSAQDMQRIVQNLPGVGNSNDETNELIVRGGSPNENLTVMDGIEIPSTNHYPNQFNSGGPINMVNVDLIEDIAFSTGGFPAQYGDKLSSVMQVTIREGDRRRQLASSIAAHFAGVSAVAEGGFADGHGSFILSARQSFLETLDKIVGISALGITAIPKYWDSQLKVVYDLSTEHKLLLSGIYGDDRIFLRGENNDRIAALANVVDSVAVDNIGFHSQQAAGGLSLKSLWGGSGYSVVTLSGLGNTADIDVRSKFTERRFDAKGSLTGERIVNERSTFVSSSSDGIVGLKGEALFLLPSQHELSFGAQWQTLAGFRNAVTWVTDTARLDLDNDGTFEVPAVTFPGGSVANDLRFGAASKAYAYVSDNMPLSSALSLTAGLRWDRFTYSHQTNISPRLSVTWEILPPLTHVSFSYGEYYQTQSWPTYGDNRQIGYNRGVLNSHARHFVLGLEHILDEGLKVNVEAYAKRYDDLPVSEQFISSADRTFRSDRNFSVGERRSTGIEFLLQQKQVHDLYGTLSYAYSTTEERDPRRPPLTDWYPSSYDYPHIATIVLGKLVKGVRTDADRLPLVLRIPTYLLPLSDDMEISFRFRYQSGNPFTPKVFVTNEQHRVGGTTWSKGWWIDGANINADRLPAYHRLDLQWISRYHLTHYNIEVVFLIENVYDRANVSMRNYRSDGTVETVYQFSFFPIAGIAVEF